MSRYLKIVSFLFLCVIQIAVAQKPAVTNAAELQQKLQKLKVLGNVLYVAAHPDDENTRLIAWMANEKKVNMGYFSFTRGDGGQNLIGPQLRDELGIIRTQELLAARRIDHGVQFFSRAVDFGYSKNPEETFRIWDKAKVLGDLVWVIRQFRPDIIITRFNTIPGTTHGHHTASALLAMEAFDLAGDPSKYPEQLKHVQPWQPKTIYWNTYWWRRSDYEKKRSEMIAYNVGAYNPLLGMSYTEIAALSRSSHKSQGFGASGSRGQQLEYLQFEKGEKAKDDAFEVVDISWNRVKGGAEINSMIDEITGNFNPENPAAVLGGLLKLRRKVNGLEDEFWRKQKLKEIDEIIYVATGLYLEAIAEDYTACPGEKLRLQIEAINRSDAGITLEKIIFNEAGTSESHGIPLKNNEDQKIETNIIIPKGMQYSQPYWLVKPHSIGLFDVDRQQLIGKPENDPALTVDFVLNIGGEQITYTKPVVYKKNDPVRGEVYRPFVISPPVFANIEGDVLLFADDRQQKVRVEVMAGKDGVEGSVRLAVPSGWKVSPERILVIPGKKRQKSIATFSVTPPAGQATGYAKAIVRADGKEYDYSWEEIDYDHIPAQILFNKPEARIVRLDLKKGHEKIGYLMGAGDMIPDNLRSIGYNVELINDLEFTPQNLDQYDVIILGIRALNTEERLKFDMDKLFDFVHRGGTMIVQYNTSHRLVTDKIAPYELQLSRSRVTDEFAKVSILNPDHRLMNFPNEITESDFEGWVQERGLYFPGSWADEFETILSCADPGEAPLKGGLLVAKFGKGYFIYTGYSWFRELPAGVPGAYRIFVNMISIGSENP